VAHPSIRRAVLRSSSAATRVDRAAEWLASRGHSTEIIVVGATQESAIALTRAVARAGGSSFGWRRFTLGGLAAALAGPTLAARGRTPIAPLSLEAVCARLVHRFAADGALERLLAIADRPGLPRALARTLSELRLERVDAAALADRVLGRLLTAFDAELTELGVADRAAVLTTAVEVVRDARHDLVGLPLLLLDVPITGACERDLIAALADRGGGLFATVPEGDDPSVAHLAALDAEMIPSAPPATPVARLQASLFADVTTRSPEAVTIFSAPGESRECVEIARRILREAETGIPFDRIAIVLRSPTQYRAHVEEALRRAGIGAYFARGALRPNPSGRALLALLACAAEGLSASRFAEYLSLGEVPDASDEGKPPAPPPATERWVPPDEELIPDIAARSREVHDDEAAPFDPSQPVVDGTLRAPRLWERLLVDAAVIGGIDRWRRRLAGLRAEMERALGDVDDPDGADAIGLRRERDALDALRVYAIPLLEDLATLPTEAAWGEWLERLSALATRALRRPDAVLSTLAELTPMATVGPVDLTEVRLVLERRLTEVVMSPRGRPSGRVYVASTDEVRGMVFDVVFVPGLAERLFPLKVTEDPLLPDAGRVRIGPGLRTNVARSALERLALRLAIGAARQRVVISYPRLDMQGARPRTPSFYGLEVLRAAEGTLPGFDELARRADAAAGTRVGWPAPPRPEDAIDDAEHDLSLLDRILRIPENDAVSTARYLLTANPHLARALRFRARRWTRAWTVADGLVDPADAARAALAAHGLTQRSYSPTALQHFAACPYRFLLQAIHRLAPREDPAPLDELNPLQRGSIFHEAQFELHIELRDAGLLPVTPANLNEARTKLDVVLTRVAIRFEDELAPAIPRVWEDGIAQIRADLRESLRRSSENADWTPVFFELSFGLTDRRARDPRSTDAPAPLDCGLQLRGSIDLVERSREGSFRATDYKTGKAYAQPGIVIDGGATLQPALYALALEKIVPDARVDAGRLYYCTSAGGFAEVSVPLGDDAREAAQALSGTIGEAISTGFLPAVPIKDACSRCDYARVCGPYEELRTGRKRRDRLVALDALRKRP
jgi:CRISPR/Cas system-associated exonuclease Cas4 (RecB family)